MSDYMHRPPAGTEGRQSPKADGPDAEESTSPTLLDALTDDGARLRDEGMRAAEYGTDLRVRSALERAIDTLAATGTEFTSEDVRRIVDPVATPNVVGAAISGAARRDVIRAVGFTTATRPEAHGRILRVWQGVVR